MTSYVRAPINFAAHQRATVGDQKISFTSFDHLGWLKCDGREISRSTYALLFNVIEETFGAGDGSTTFNLPNYAGCVPGMAGRPAFNQSVNNATYTRGNTDGEQRHQLTIGEMPAHKHGSVDVSANTNGDGFTTLNGAHSHTTNTQTPATHNHGGSTGPGGFATTPVDVNNITTQLDVADNNAGGHTHSINPDGAHTHTTNTEPDHRHAMGSTGGSQYHNNMQPTLFGGHMYIFSGRMYSGLGTYPYSAATDLA